jgi:hypothetical protein
MMSMSTSDDTCTLTWICTYVKDFDMLAPTSIFRRMPAALSLSLRRLLGALAYASDSAELSFTRLTMERSSRREFMTQPSRSGGAWPGRNP